jgi:hypothetical protein
VSLAKTIARKAFGGLQSVVASGDRQGSIKLVAPQACAADLDEIRRRAAFYFAPAQAARLTVHGTFSSSLALDASPILLFGDATARQNPLAKLHGGVFDVDWRVNPREGWNWVDAAAWAAQHVPDVSLASQRFSALRERLLAKGLGRCYVFGTGPSLGAAQQRDWSDGLRVVCNTIVRDAALWRHIQPDVLVAGDGIYHFGFTDFARAFRRDLRLRLQESPHVPFVYPAEFDLVVRRDLAGLEEQLIPVPVGAHATLHNSFDGRFALPCMGNVLNLLLLPVGCALSRQVGLWGFDGRAPADQLFWANSTSQSYTELLPTLQAAHPAFFDHHVPKHDPEKYLRSVHGDVLEHALVQAEQAGWRFEMLHPTWTATLARRAAAGVASLP